MSDRVKSRINSEIITQVTDQFYHQTLEVSDRFAKLQTCRTEDENVPTDIYDESFGFY